MESVAHEINQLTDRRIIPPIYPLDIHDHDKIPEIVEGIKSKFNRIDILVNNAGKWIRGTLDISKEDFTDIMNINLIAPYLFINEIVPIMRQQKKGYIFNIASRAGKVGYIRTGVYSASKFGLVGMSESMYLKLAPDGIKVTTLCPAYVNTQMAFDADTPLAQEEMIQPEDIMETIRWLIRMSPFAYVKEIVIECKTNVFDGIR